MTKVYKWEIYKILKTFINNELTPIITSLQQLKTYQLTFGSTGRTLKIRQKNGKFPTNMIECSFSIENNSKIDIKYTKLTTEKQEPIETTHRRYRHTLLYWAFQILHFFFFFYKMKVCGNSASSKSTGTIFPTASAHFLSLCHILITVTIFQTFYHICYGDL